MTINKVKQFKGHEIVSTAIGGKTLTCKVRLPSGTMSKELDSVAAAKIWINQRDNQQPSVLKRIANWLALPLRNTEQTLV